MRLNSLNRKKYQRRMNKIVRHLNKSIKNDWLWNGRFVVSQKGAYFQPYEDHSGALYSVIVVCTDTKTGKHEETWLSNYGTAPDLWRWVNKCIVEIWKVWDENPNPNEQARLEGREPPPWRN